MNQNQNPVEDERAWLQRVLTRDIPMGGAMELEVVRVNRDGVVLELPLEANINDKGTAFGGSLASAMILAGWSIPRLLLRRAGLTADLVIGRCETRFLTPVCTAFQACCSWPGPAQVAEFHRKFTDRGRAGLDLHAEIRVDSQVAATLAARYAALGEKR